MLTKFKSIGLILNEKAGSVSHLEEYKRVLEESGIDLDYASSTHSIEKFEEHVSSAINQGCQAIIIGGGDGTQNIAAKLLVGSDVVHIPLPAGTTNNFVRTLGLPHKSTKNYFKILTTKQLKVIDIHVGEINDGEYLFTNMAAVGISTQVAKLTTTSQKKRFGQLAYVWNTMRSVGRTQQFDIQVDTEAETFNFKTSQIVIGNMISVSSINLSKTEISKPELQILVYLGKHSRVALLIEGLKLLIGRSTDTKQILVQGAVLSSKTKLKVEADGEVLTSTPATFKIAKQTLKTVQLLN